jgi:hypothetical protein
MGQRSRIELLPDEVLAELNERLVKGRFAGYVELAEWLTGKGFEISKTALHRYGQKFEDKLAALKLATDQARAVVDAAPDDDGAMNEALMRLIQEKLFGILRDLNIDPKKINIASLVRAVAEFTRANVAHRKYRAHVREKATAAAATVAKLAKKGGLSKATAAEIRREILGIPA